MVDDTGPTKRERLTLRDKLVAVCIATILIAIILAIFRLGIAALYG
ncbi:hypothetical protein HN018_18830 [Lichenicola cladoniae]|uniref:Uncharacterized protein n=1 Tax=Lichenicola cladoniae TaxID=1484109 RepID=A0A6M8HTI2_9PROT|nr:hypothetical protein [Lichenicola cladoniae]NPD67533.1 hypothetical protein [Acetobacteraceae bacterium]QKE91813.1 hypothetical protein HN018_18830 [Lichenicola cladoniae]